MAIFEKLEKCLTCLLRIFCPPIYIAMFSDYQEMRCLKGVLGFAAGFILGQYYYTVFLKDIPFLSMDGFILSLLLSILLGVGVTLSTQMRCISLLLFPTYCGKAGRGVLKAVVLTYVVAGPITNMGLNAKEVVRVFACSTELADSLSKTKHVRMYRPLNKALLGLSKEVEGIKDTMRSIHDVITPIDLEIVGVDHLRQMKAENDLTDALFDVECRSEKDPKIIRYEILGHKKAKLYQNIIMYIHLIYIVIGHFYFHTAISQQSFLNPCGTLIIHRQNVKLNESAQYQKGYQQKLDIRCENQLSHSIVLCMRAFMAAFDECIAVTPPYATMLCWPLMLPRICDIKQVVGTETCTSKKQINPGLGYGYHYLKLAERELISNLKDIKLQHKITYEREIRDVQNAKETGDRVLFAFQEKFIIMKLLIATVNICLAMLFLRIVFASHSYHELYLTSIDYDNVYITGLFKRIDKKRLKKGKFALLPLKKMERNRYIDVNSASYIPSERSKLLTQILKVMLEAVTATTFVMLDRLFYEALDVVRQHALETAPISELQDLVIKVESNGLLSSMLGKVFRELNSTKYNNTVSNEKCLPRPRAMPTMFYFKIYVGYIWILLLLYINPYTLRLRRLICSYFYPVREKQRILHLYNDILKKRVRMQKTLRRKAVQAVRAHYLSGENLLSLRMRFPAMLGWLETLPVARMKCLICEETAPRNYDRINTIQWHSCIKTRCPFVYCEECWQEVGSQCLACDPALAELSDIDSMSDDNPPRY